MKNWNPVIGVLLTCIVISIAACSSGGGGSDDDETSCGDSNYIYVRGNGNDSNPGTLSQPLATIQAAVSCGVAGQAIFVAEGTYEAGDSGKIRLLEGLSIFGGFSSDFSVQDPNVYTTTITSSQDGDTADSNTTSTVEVTAGTTAATVLDGFTINGTGVGNWAVVTTVLVSGGAATISRNVLNGGSAGTVNVIEVEAGGYPTIEDNVITGGDATASDSTGILSDGGTNNSAIITRNTIRGGSSPGSTFGIQWRSAGSQPMTIAFNEIDGGFMAGSSFGVTLALVESVVLESNTITSGDGASQSRAVDIDASVASSTLRNHVINLDGTSNSMYGISTNASSEIYNNTIVGGAGAGIPLAVYGIYIGLNASPVIRNNLFEIASGRCFWEASVNADPVSFENNNLFGCSTLYQDEVATPIGTIAGVNNLMDTTAVDNVSVSSLLGSAPNFRLTGASPAAVTQGGLDLSGQFSLDKDDTLRTVPWSIGAYELD